MIDQSRFELMKKDLTKAAHTIQILKKERDEYKVSYEMLKEESVSKKDLLRNHSHLESLRDSNESLQNELLRYRHILKDRDKEISHLQELLKNSQKSLKSQSKTIQAIENARQELNYEISSTNFKSTQFSKFSETLQLVEILFSSLKKCPSVYSMFKNQVQCKKRFKSLVENSNYSITFNYLLKFVLDLISNFEFCEDEISPLEASSRSYYSKPEEAKVQNRSNYNMFKESTEQSLARVEKLDKKLFETINSSKNDSNAKDLTANQGPHKKMMRSETSAPDHSSRSLKSFRNRAQGNEMNEELEESDDELANTRSFNKSKSPSLRVNSPKDRFDAFVVPFKKKDASASVAECMGKRQNKKQ